MLVIMLELVICMVIIAQESDDEAHVLEARGMSRAGFVVWIG